MRHQLNGVLVLNKPAGISSASAVAKVKRMFAAAKVGHAGTLDPFATGVLVCCINQATRLARFFLQGFKTYEAVLQLGRETDTQDATGTTVAEAPVPGLTRDDLNRLLKQFEGRQMQQPPVFAALKHQGRPLYQLARMGTPVQKPARPVIIERLRMLRFEPPAIGLEVTCSAGTYIRTLCADIGRAIGCGGHMAALHRTAGSGFSISEALSLEQLGDMPDEDRWSKVIGMADALRGIPAVCADERALAQIRHGRKLAKNDLDRPPDRPGAHEMCGHIKVVDTENRLKAVLQITPDDDLYNYCCVFN
jgi:tRNA pseudouridine55 synthase